MNEKFWFLKNCDLFERLTDEQIAGIEQRSRSRRFERNGLIYVPSDQGDAVLLLTSGRVRIHHLTGEGKQALLAIIEPGELFGELAVFDGGHREEFAEAMEPSVVVSIPGAVVRELMERQPMVSLEVTRLMGLRRQRVERRLKSLLFRSNRERLVSLLLELAEKYGSAAAEGVGIDIRLSHQDLASMIGSTRETVTVLLGELREEGLLIVRRRQVVLAQPEKLAESVDLPLPRTLSPAPSPGGLPRKAGLGT